ncbi:hypothetical protein ATE47_07605 [Chryseobacterium sp. IHB B 17019]|jgi:hypothetical protein|uniref:hypothetical protein n=1 Tax=Chryseobacterium sp. IHB B 17019 TaxID=1721091 RepID=UPI00071F645F|nr:hypothetical protein [Chryseobacterium sp. IHB B 17019]ALR30397.1 hypothetical protein ATE47_07605 [Chryseobacterium sp. IHB B 17019]
MKKILLITTLFLLLFSCTENKPENELIVENAVENAESKSYSRYSNGQNMIDAIYHEQIKDDENLKNLDERINTIQEDSRKVKDIYREILNKSAEYYSDAESEAKSMTDSILKKQTLELIKASAEKNYTKEKKFRDLILEINRNNELIYNQYSAFKIKRTLPEIEKYQNAHPLKTDSLNNFIKKQNQLLEELKKLK